MNKELINRLRLDAGIAQVADSAKLVVINREGNIIDPIVGLEKFAELIIEECETALNPMLRDMISRGHAYRLIKKHFGVEK